MIDDKKIEEAANLHRFEIISSMHGSTLGTHMQCSEEVVDAEIYLIENSFIAGVKWTINEFLKDLWHPSSEEPKNLEYIVFTTTMFGEVYLFTKQVDNTQDWKTIVETHGIEQWVYRDDIVSLIFKEVKE